MCENKKDVGRNESSGWQNHTNKRGKPCKMKSMIGREHILQGLAEHVKDLGFTKDVAIIEDFEAQR